MSFRYLFSFYRVTSKCILYRKLAETPRDHELRFSLYLSLSLPSSFPFFLSLSLSFLLLLHLSAFRRQKFRLNFQFILSVAIRTSLVPFKRNFTRRCGVYARLFFFPLFFVLFFFHRVLSAFASLCLEIDFRRVPLEELATFFLFYFYFVFQQRRRSNFSKLFATCSAPAHKRTYVLLRFALASC